MTVKQFFKSTSFKCLVTLLCILLVCGIFLTIAYGFLEVTDEERFNRAIAKIYGEEKQTTAIEFDENDGKFATSTILNAYLDEDGNYLIKSKGSGGYAGTVTCWVLVIVKDGAVDSVNKVSIETSDGETLLSSINFLDKYASVEYTDGYEYTTDDGFVTAGASMSSGAINNAVNGAVNFVRFVCLGETDPYGEIQYYDFINFDETTWTVENGSISYHIVTKTNSPAKSFVINIVVGSDKKISSYEIETIGSTDPEKYAVLASVLDGSLFEGKSVDDLEATLGDGSYISAGATKSSTLCMQAALFAVANYDYCLNNDTIGDEENSEQTPDEKPDDGKTDVELVNTEYINLSATTWTADGANVNYNIVTNDFVIAVSFTIEITVGQNGVISAYDIKINGCVEGFEEEMHEAILDGSLFEGKSLEDIQAILGGNTAFPGEDMDTEISTGATYSNYLCYYAALFATSNYDNCLAQGGNN